MTWIMIHRTDSFRDVFVNSSMAGELSVRLHTCTLTGYAATVRGDKAELYLAVFEEIA